MAKKLESSKATAKHIKQHTSNMQGGAQIHILRHNQTSLPAKKKKGSKKPNPIKGTKPQQQRQPYQQQSYNRNSHQCISWGDYPHMQRFSCLAKKYQCKHCNKIGHFTKMCFTNNVQPQSQQCNKCKPNQAHQIIITEQPNEQYKSADESDDEDDFMIAYQMYAQPQKNVNSQKASTSYTKKCLYTNIPYRLQPCHKHSNYLCAQLDTYADVNLVQESVYKLVFNDPHTSKLAKNYIDLTVYTRQSVDVISKCTFFMLSKDTKQPVKVDFHTAKVKAVSSYHI